MLIGKHQIGRGCKPFIVAEAAFNHNGDFYNALTMVHDAHAAGCDAVKFQTYKTEEFCQPDDPLFRVFKRGELPVSAWPKIKAECDRIGITFLSTPQNRSDLDLLLSVGVPAVKVGSDDLTNLPLLRDYTASGLPLILSCGMSNMGEVYEALDTTCAFDGYPVALLVCTSQYPTPPDEANLARITTLRAAFPSVPIGYSDHTVGPEASIAAVALGACIFERHFTIDKSLPLPDSSFACNAGELKAWASSIRTVTAMLGTGLVRPTVAEMLSKSTYQRRPGNQLRGMQGDSK